MSVSSNGSETSSSSSLAAAGDGAAAAKAARPLRVAVTGGSGQVGSFVVRHLVERGHSVLNLDRREAREPRAKLVYIDLRRREQVQPVFERVDAVVHLGEIPHSHYPLAPDEIFAHNTAVGATVLQTAADLKLQRFIYTSTIQVYGVSDAGKIPPAHVPFDETHPLRPRNVYAAGKVANEGYCRLVAETQGLSVAIFRLPWTVCQPVNDRWLEWLEHDSPDFDGLGAYVHGDDAARAFVAALEDPRPGCEAYNLSAAEAMSATPVRRRILERHQGFPLPPEDWPGYKSLMLAEKAHRHFGWAPQWNLLDVYRQRKGRDPIAVASPR